MYYIIKKEGKNNMHVSILNQGFTHEKTYQIMIVKSGAVYHVYPGKLFTLEEAKTICNNNGFIIDAVGTLYQIIK